MGKLTQKDLLLLDELKGELKRIKDEELACRLKIINHFRYGNNVEGVQHKSIDDSDIDICVTLKLNRTLDQDAIETLWSDFDDAQRDCIKIVYELKAGPYKKLVKAKGAGKLPKCVIEKPGLASVELKYEE